MTKHGTPHKKKELHKERGFWITALLLISLVRNTLGAFAIFALRSDPNEDTSQILIAALVFLAIADVVAVIGMWFWKRWGYYLLLLSSAGAGTIALLMTGLFYMLFHAILPPMILAYIIQVQKKWDYFE